MIASVFFVVTSGGDFGFSAQALKYSVAFALCYGVSSLTSMMAIYTGPLALTSLIIQYSLIIPTIYGLVALGESVSLMLILGILLLMISLIFINIESKGEKKKITLKWGIYVFLAFLGNGGCSTVQKIQQIDCDGMYKNEFMIVALVITGIVLMIYGKISEKDRFAINIKKGFFWFVMCGAANGLVNLFVIILSGRMPVSVMFPVISAGGIVAAALVSVFLYKEKLSLYQKIGMFLGTLAIVALNI